MTELEQELLKQLKAAVQLLEWFPPQGDTFIFDNKVKGFKNTIERVEDARN